MHADYSELTLDQAKSQALNEIEVWYGGAGQDVFDSAAKGAVYRYYCGPEYVSRIVSLSTAKGGGVAGQLMCGKVPTNPDGTLITDQDPIWAPIWHTAVEIKSVHQHYADFIGKIDAQRDVFVTTVFNATNTEDLEVLVDSLINFRIR